MSAPRNPARRGLLAGGGASLALAGALSVHSAHPPCPAEGDAALVVLHRRLDALRDREDIAVSAADRAECSADDAELARWEAELAAIHADQRAVRLAMAAFPALGLAGVLVKALVLSDAATQGACEGTPEIADSLAADAARLAPWLAAGGAA